MSTTGTLVNPTAVTGTNRTDVQVSKDWLNASQKATGGATGALMMRDDAQTLDWGWLDAVAVGQVLASGGVGVAPAWTASPTLTSVVLSGGSVLEGSTANVIEQRNGTNAQASRWYRTYTDASNYARASVFTSGNDIYIGQDAGDLAGTGTAGDVVVLATTGKNASFRAGALRLNWTDTSGGLLMLGGATSSFPAFKRSSATVLAQLADDSARAAFGSLYQYFGSGSPEAAVTAPVGSIFHRTDGGAATSIYVKESGAGNTGWVAK